MIKNVYRYTNLNDECLKFNSVKEYEEAEKKFLKFGEEIKNIPPKERMPFLNQQVEEFSKLLARPSPDLLVAICPYCSRKIWARIKNGIFTLNASFWVMEYDNGKIVTDDSKCEHLFAMDGALNLLNQPVPMNIKPFGFIRNKIYMGSEVPFVKPRILSKEGVMVVIHSILVAEKYIGYPITYFTNKRIPQREFITGWAREEYCDRDEMFSENTFVGKRVEPHDYDLEKWVKKDKVKWLTENSSDLILNSGEDLFPYYNIAGRKNPYQIQDGKIIDFPNCNEVQTNIEIETFMPRVV